MVILDDEHLGDTILAGNTNVRGNRMMEIRDLDLSYPHIVLHTGNAKYIIVSRKTETVTNVIIHKNTEGVEYY